jgi:hypothetical protein
MSGFVKDLYFKVYNYVTSKIETSEKNQNENTIRWGKNDKYPIDVLNAIYASDTAQSLYETYFRFLIGEGFSNESQNLIPANKDQLLVDVLRDIGKQFTMLRSLAMLVKYHPNMRVASIEAMPIESIRYVLPKDGEKIKYVKYNPYWGRKDYKQSNTKTYPLWTSNPLELKEQMSQPGFCGSVYVYTEKKPLHYYYSEPLSYNNLDLLNADARITQLHQSNLSKNLFISAVMTIKGDPSAKVPTSFDTDGNPTSYRTSGELLDDRLSQIATGSENAGSMLVNWTTGSAEEAVSIVAPPNTINDTAFLSLEGNIIDKIARIVKVPPLLANIQVSGKLGSSNEIENSNALMNVIVLNDQKLLCEILKEILGVELEIKPLVLLSQIEKLDPSIKVELFGLLPPEKKKQLAEDVYNVTWEDAMPGQVTPGTDDVDINDNLRNMTGRQQQQFLRIIRQFSKGQITEEVAIVQLKGGFGLNDEEIKSVLGINEVTDGEATTD